MRDVFYQHFIDDQLNVVVLITVDLHSACQLFNRPIYTNVHVALFAHALEEFAVVAFTVSHQRREDVDLLARIVV